MKIRSVHLKDASELLSIYSSYVLNTAVSFEIEAPSAAEFLQRIVDKTSKYPWLVCESEHQILGYAYADAFRTRPAYAWSVETSVYIRSEFRGRGIGKLLYANLIKLLKEQGVVNVIAGMAMPNEPSRKLHEHFGFVHVGRYRDVGYKFGEWRDVGYWQLQLSKPDLPTPLGAPGTIWPAEE